MLNFKNILKLFRPDFRLGNKPVFILFILCISSSYSQENLIYNGDFEEYIECPLGASNPTQNPKEITKCLGWRAPTYGTSDFYHECALGNNVGVPQSNTGFQYAFSGKGYLGGFLASFTGGSGDDGYTGIMWWEYIQGELTKPLEKGKKYKLCMRISVAEYFDLVVNEFGAYFSENAITSPNTSSLSVTPQCTFYNENYFMDSISWVKVESTFIAKGNEKYITIGNFNDNNSTDSMRRLEMEHPLFSSYMYFDAVELHEEDQNIESLEISNFFSPNDDKMNDLWTYPFLNKSEKIFILNRWGNIIQTLDESNQKWNGQNSDGTNCSEGIY